LLPSMAWTTFKQVTRPIFADQAVTC
jgi:hypothetical protein